MEGDRSYLTESAPYLKVFVINGKYKLYGQTHIIYYRLRLTLPLSEYLKAPYIIITTKEKIGKGFLWFWYSLNGLVGYDKDEYWSKMTLFERLDVWPHLKAHLPGMFKWYYDNLFVGLTLVRDDSLIPVLDDILSTVPQDNPCWASPLSRTRCPNGKIPMFDIGYNIITSLPVSSLICLSLYPLPYYEVGNILLKMSTCISFPE